jgi:mRNA interferase MazF
MKRGDIVIVSAPGAYGKPRPAVIVQSDRLEDTDSILVCLISSMPHDTSFHRVAVMPDETNKLKTTSQIMVDKIIAIPRKKCERRAGRLDEVTLVTLNSTLSLVLGLKD